MTITVDIKPEIQAELERKAAERGVDVPAFVATLIEQAAQPEAEGRKYDRPPGRKSLVDLFAESPLRGLDLDSAFTKWKRAFETVDSELDDRLYLFLIQTIEPLHNVVNIGSRLEILKR